MLPQQPAHLEQLAGDKTPLVSQERETDAELGRQLPCRNLPSGPATHQAPTGRGNEAKLGQLGFNLARQGGAVRDQLRARAGEEPRQFLGFGRDINAASAPVREVPGQFLGITAIRFDLIVGGHRDGRRIDHEVGDAGRGEGAV